MRRFSHHDVVVMKNHKQVGRLRRATRYRRDWEVREAACDAVGELDDTHAIKPLIVALRDEYWPVRRAAAWSLGKIGDARAVEPLIAALAAEDTGQAGATVPVRFGYTDFPGLHDSWTVRRAIVTALGEFADARALTPLVSALRDVQPRVRQEAARALGKLDDPRAIDPLIVALTDEHASVRAAAAAALDGLGWRPHEAAAEAAYLVATEHWGESAKTGVIAPLLRVLDDEDPAIRGVVAATLADVGAPAVEPLIAAVNDPRTTWRGRSGAAEALGRIGDPRAVEALIGALPDAACATALGQIGEVRAVQPLIAALETGETGDRRAAAAALGQLGDGHAVPPLITALNDHDGDLRAAAAAALDRLAWRPEGSAAAATYWVITHQWDKAVQVGAVEPLVVALRDRAAWVRKPAAQALGRIGDARAVEPLSTALNDQDIEVAKAAARALVAMYSSGKLDEAQKAKVLAQRDRITFQDDVPDHEGVDVRDDRTIGVAFPI